MNKKNMQQLKAAIVRDLVRKSVTFLWPQSGMGRWMLHLEIWRENEKVIPHDRGVIKFAASGPNG